MKNLYYLPLAAAAYYLWTLPRLINEHAAAALQSVGAFPRELFDTDGVLWYLWYGGNEARVFILLLWLWRRISYQEVPEKAMCLAGLAWSGYLTGCELLQTNYDDSGSHSYLAPIVGLLAGFTWLWGFPRFKGNAQKPFPAQSNNDRSPDNRPQPSQDNPDS